MLAGMDGRRAVSIKDVARAAGVSTTTVSHALNDKGRLPASTREHVRKVAEDLGYRPSAIARGLVSGRTGVLGLAVSVPGPVSDSFASIQYFAQVINGATAAATARGYALVVVPADGNGEVWRRVAVDGAVVVDPVSGDLNPDAIRAQGLPVVTIASEPDRTEAGWCVDDETDRSIALVMDHLVEQGARHPAVLTWEWHDAFTDDSIAAYRRWCADRSLEPHVVEIETTDLATAFETADRRAAELVDEVDAHDAVFALYEPLGAIVLRAAAERGIAVPAELLVAAARDTGVGRTTLPTLTVLEFQPDLLGAEAVGLLIDRLETPAMEATTRIVPSLLTVGGSTARS
jgi:DNA-binding LacI/PurR family transcriptional regulator